MNYSKHLVLLLLFVSIILTPVEASKNRGIDSAVRRLLKNCDKCDDTGLYIKSLKLAELGTQAIPCLVSSLKNADNKEKLVIIQALGEIQNEQPVKNIVSFLKDNNPAIRTAAAGALELMKGREAVGPLIEGIKTEKDTEVKCRMIKALGPIGDERAVEPLIELLKGSSDEIAASVAIALREYKDTRIVEPLINSLGDRSYYAMDEIFKTLAKIGKPVLKPLIKAALDNKRRSDEHIFALGYMKHPDALEALMKIISRGAGSLSADEDKAVYLSGKASIPYLETIIRNEYIKKFWADKLKKTGIMEKTADRIKFESDARRKSIAKILGRIHEKSAVFILIDLLKDPDEYVVNEVIKSLGEIGDKRATDYLLPFLRHDNEEIKKETVEALGKLKDKRAVEPLIRILKDKEDPARDEAAVALGAIGDKRATMPLIEAVGNMRDPDWKIIGLLGEMKDKCALKPLLKLLEQKKQTTFVLRGLGKIKSPEVFDILVKYLETKGNEEQFEAVCALAEMKDERAIAPIVRFIKNNSWPDGVDLSNNKRFDFPYLGSSLAAFGKPALPAITRLLEDKHWQVRIIAGAALSAIDDPKAQEVLMDVLKNRNLAAIAGGRNFYISKGKPGTETVLVESLNKYGDFWMTGVFLCSGNRILEKAATYHGRKNRYCFTCMRTLGRGVDLHWGKDYRAKNKTFSEKTIQADKGHF